MFKHVEGQQPNKNKVWTSGTNGLSLSERKFALDTAEENVVPGSGIGHGSTEGTVVHE
jgi:hypothetical protein